MKKLLLCTLAALFMSIGVASAEVNVNTANEAELAKLPGIGDVKAAAIVDYRQAHGEFASLADLADVKGIGDATVADLKGEAVVGGAQ